MPEIAKTELAVLAEKLKRRTKTNFRTYRIVRTAAGGLFTQAYGEYRRKQQLDRGAARRHGEKIVGVVCVYQHGVNNHPGRFSEAAKQLREFRRIIDTEGYNRASPKEYFEGRIDSLLYNEKRSTQHQIRQLKGLPANGSYQLIVPTITQGGKQSSTYVVRSQDRQSFRVVLDDQWHRISEGETLELAVLRKQRELSQRMWPDDPDCWIVVPEVASNTTANLPTTPVKPIPGQLVYGMWDGKVLQYEFQEETILPGASVPSWIVRDPRECRRVSCAVGYYKLTKAEVIQEEITQYEEGLKRQKRQIVELQNTVEETREQLCVLRLMLKKETEGGSAG